MSSIALKLLENNEIVIVIYKPTKIVISFVYNWTRQYLRHEVQKNVTKIKDTFSLYCGGLLGSATPVTKIA